jgi:hypothetical protein
MGRETMARTREARSYMPLFILIGLYTGRRKQAILVRERTRSLSISNFQLPKAETRFLSSDFHGELSVRGRSLDLSTKLDR